MPDQSSQEEVRGGFARTLVRRLSVRRPAVRATMLTFGSYFLSQVIRFGSNLILTRLLLPDVFGLMLIINLVVQGLEMFSDLGLGPSVIQNRRGEEAVFLCTAWTVNIIKNSTLWVIALVLAWPLSWWFNEPQLAWLLPAAGLTLITNASVSAQVGVARRRLLIGRLVTLEIGSYLFTVAIMIGVAAVHPTVWALVAGSLIGGAAFSLLTHLTLGGEPMRFTLDREVVRELIHFGRWLFISSILTFLCGQLDRIVLSGFMNTTELGVYSIAFMLSQAVVMIVDHVGYRILFPVYARAAEAGRAQLRRQVLRFRLALMGIALPPLWILILFGPEVIRFLYPDAYQAAGVFLQVLAVGGTFAAVLLPVENVLMASGDSFRHMLLQFIKSTFMIGFMSLGGYLYGAWGVILGFTASRVLYYPLQAGLVRRYGVWMPLLDAAALAASACVAGAAFWLRG